MKPSEDQKLLEIVKATGEIYGKQVSLAAALMFLADLDNYPSDAISASLAMCRKELKTFPTVSDVIARIDDGRPGVEQAWAMIPKDEYSSVVWTSEMAEAFGVCRMMINKDPIAARMAFKEAYLRLMAEARSAGRPPDWKPSLGFEKSGRVAAISEAVQKGRITHEVAQNLLPDYSIPSVQRLKLDFLKDMPK